MSIIYNAVIKISYLTKRNKTKQETYNIGICNDTNIEQTKKLAEHLLSDKPNLIRAELILTDNANILNMRKIILN